MSSIAVSEGTRTIVYMSLSADVIGDAILDLPGSQVLAKREFGAA